MSSYPLGFHYSHTVQRHGQPGRVASVWLFEPIAKLGGGRNGSWKAIDGDVLPFLEENEDVGLAIRSKISKSNVFYRSN